MQGITKLCDLYKQSKSNFLKIKSTAEEIASDAKAVKSWWQRLFGTETTTPKLVAKKTTKFVDYNESQAMADIVSKLTEFWTLQDKLAEYLRAEEEKAKVYDPTVTNAQQMQTAMNRIMCQQEMEKLEVTIREIMVYQTPGLADLYTQTFEMRGVIRDEQEKARIAKEKQEKEMAWQRRQEKRSLHLKVAWVVATFIFLLYLWLWLALVSRWQKM